MYRTCSILKCKLFSGAGGELKILWIFKFDFARWLCSFVNVNILLHILKGKWMNICNYVVPLLKIFSGLSWRQIEYKIILIVWGLWVCVCVFNNASFIPSDKPDRHRRFRTIHCNRVRRSLDAFACSCFHYLLWNSNWQPLWCMMSIRQSSLLNVFLLLVHMPSCGR